MRLPAFRLFSVLVTGDLVQDDTPVSALSQHLFGNLKKPVLCIPGNHDEPAAMQRELSCAPFQIAAHVKSMIGQFIMLDSYNRRARRGRLTQNELARSTARWPGPAEATPWSVCIITRSRWQPLVGHRGSREP